MMDLAHDTDLSTIQFQPPIIQFEPISQFVYCLPFWLSVQVSSVQNQCTMPEAECLKQMVGASKVQMKGEGIF
jgi:hypothetical protein